MENIKFGVVGLGRLGRQHAENIRFRISGADLTAVCSIDSEELENARRDFGEAIRTYTDFDVFLKDPEMNAVLICSPSGFHCEQIIRSLDAGYHVFCEKPLGLYYNEAVKAAQKAEEHKGQVFMLGFMRRYDPSYAYAKEKIEQGIIGKPYYIRCYGIDPQNSIDGYLKFAKENYSGGLFLDMAIHDLDLARWYLESEGDTVWAVGGTFKYPEIEELNDAEAGTAMIQFKNGAMGVFLAGRNCAHGYHIETEIIGTNGMLRIGATPDKNLVTIFDESGIRKETMGGFLERFQEAYLAEVTEFVNCIKEGKSPGVSAEDGVRSTALGYACKEAFESGALVKLS